MRYIRTFTLLALSAPALAQEILFEIDGTGIPGFASAVIDVGDLDGDGVREIAIGLSDVSSVEIRSGATGAVLLTLGGVAPPPRLGIAVADAGDTDGDGVPDVVVGALDSVYLYSGASGSVLWFSQGVAFDRLGKAVAGVGDWNVDGYDDVVVGAPQLDVSSGCDVFHGFVQGPGYVQVLSGRDGTTLASIQGAVPGHGFGSTVAGPGDVDGDGRVDLVVWTRQHALLIENGGRTLWRAAVPASPARRSGTLVGTPGDLDGDGLAEVAFASELGYAFVVPGGQATRGTSFVSSIPYDQFGSSIASAGDVDADGVGDFIVGATQPPVAVLCGSYRSNGPGYVELVSGADGSTIATLVGDVIDQRFGLQVGAVGDVDADGRDDVFVATLDGVRVYSMRSGVTQPARYCAGKPNPTGTSARIDFRGTTSIANNDLRLRVGGGMPGELAFFFFGAGRQSAPFGGGLLCVTEPLRRLPTAAILDAQGAAEIGVDLASDPASTILAGTTRSFQAWYRAPGSATVVGNPTDFNTSDAIALLFAP